MVSKRECGRERERAVGKGRKKDRERERERMSLGALNYELTRKRNELRHWEWGLGTTK